MARKKGAILEQLAAKAMSLGADGFEVEYKDGCEEVFAVKSGFGLGIASLRSSTAEAKSLRNELYALTKKKQSVRIGDRTYELRARIYDSFGEDAFRIELR
jgi:hypothetical protein